MSDSLWMNLVYQLVSALNWVSHWLLICCILTFYYCFLLQAVPSGLFLANQSTFLLFINRDDEYFHHTLILLPKVLSYQPTFVPNHIKR